MNKNYSNIISKDNKNLLLLFFMLFLSLILSALIFSFIGQEDLIKIDYDSLKKYAFLDLFLEILKRNIIYFIVVIFLANFGFVYTIYSLFCLVSIMYGISIIYFTKIITIDKLYFIFNFTDYLVYFPFLFYFTHMSTLVSKYIKNLKKVETKSKKIDIIIIGYLKLSAIFVLLVIAYSLIYSYYIHLIL